MVNEVERAVVIEAARILIAQDQSDRDCLLEDGQVAFSLQDIGDALIERFGESGDSKRGPE